MFRCQPYRTWEKVAAHGGKKNGEEERVVPPGSNPDALWKKREGRAEEGYQTLVNCADLAIPNGEEVTNEELKDKASRLAVTFWGRIGFFFVPMPCALEALTVINPLFRLSLSKGETIT